LPSCGSFIALACVITATTPGARSAARASMLRDAPAGDRAGDEHGVGHARQRQVAGVVRLAADLQRTVDAVQRSADAGHACAPAVCSARTIARRASVTLKPFCDAGRAPCSSRSAASPNAASVGFASDEPASASGRRHGLCATPPSASAASADDAAAHVQRRGHRHQRERVARAVAHLQVVRVAGEAVGRQVDADDQLAGGQRGVALRRVAGQAVEVGDRDDALAARAAHAHARAQAASATHMSDGCVAMQAALAPRIAWLRLMPSIAPQPLPGARLLQCSKPVS
jgi:hypothetical protein